MDPSRHMNTVKVRQGIECLIVAIGSVQRIFSLSSCISSFRHTSVTKTVEYGIPSVVHSLVLSSLSYPCRSVPTFSSPSHVEIYTYTPNKASDIAKPIHSKTRSKYLAILVSLISIRGFHLLTDPTDTTDGLPFHIVLIFLARKKLNGFNSPARRPQTMAPWLRHF